MWPRVVELMLGCWLLVSPFVFRGTPEVERYTWSVVAAGSIVVLASLLAWWRPTAQARFATLLAALWLTGHGYFAAARPGPPSAQNEIMIGLLLLIFAVLPNDTNRPPEPWRDRRAAER